MTEQAKRTIGQQALDLDVDLSAGRRQAGRVEQMVAAAIDAGIDRGVVDADLDAGAGALAVSMARAVDRGAHDPYAVAAVGRELAQLLARLRLDVEARTTKDAGGRVAGDAESWLRSVTEPT